MTAPSRIVSLLPSATEILFAIGAGNRVVGVTHECDYPEAARDLPKVTSNAVIAAGDVVAHKKPAPDVYRFALDALGCDPGSCVAIEDSRWGLEAACKAGLRPVAITHTYPAAELPGAVLVVDHLSDITIPRLEQLFTR